MNRPDAPPKRAIVIAAGRGRRLMPYTDRMPKCLVPVGSRPILGWQLDAFRAHGISEVVIIRGYLREVLGARAAELGDGVRFVENAAWADNNILESLFCAEADLGEAVLVTYSDILFTPEIVGRLVDAPGDISLVVDRDFAAVYEGRSEHPLEEAEVADVDRRGLVRRVGKRALPPRQAWGEFIGLAKLSARGAGWLREAWRDLSARYAGRENEPFQRAPRFRVAYLTDMLQHLIDAGHPVASVDIRGGWREIDTVQDLERARALVKASEEEWT